MTSVAPRPPASTGVRPRDPAARGGIARRLARRFALPLLAAAALPAHAFCGFYVGKADASLFNEASQVILVRDGPRTVISMLNDYRGELSEFALVVPVPQVLARGQIHVGDRRLFERIDAYSAPRLAEYHDADPCERPMLRQQAVPAPSSAAKALGDKTGAARALGVTVEARYTVGEYDIAILSARESDGLESWLVANGYRMPAGASGALAPYVRQGMKFFVARVNLGEHARLAASGGVTTLRPLQFAFESPKFMLPMRLGMLNASGPQDLIVYALTRAGRVESTNYRTVRLPANIDLPVFVRGEFDRFYRSMFERQARREDYRAVFTEYVWDMAWCDPCAADPLTPDELAQAGVFWVAPTPGTTAPGDAAPSGAAIAPGFKRAAAPAPQVMLTRLHLRYTRDSFPEDLVFQETADRQNFQTRYVLRHPFKGSPSACEAAQAYYDEVARRQRREAQTLAELTGWSLPGIRTRMEPREPGQTWWSRLWHG
jgi:hypothetical protein